MSPEQREHLELQLSAYLDGELSAAERQAVEATLAGDDAARRLLAELRATVEVVRKLPRARAGEGLMDAVRSRLERQALLDNRAVAAIAPQRSSRAGNWLAAAAMISLTLLTGYTLWPLLTPEPTRPNPQYAMQKQVAPEFGREAHELARDAVGRGPVADESIAGGDYVASPPPREAAGIRLGDVDNADREQFGAARALAAGEGKTADQSGREGSSGIVFERVPAADSSTVAGAPTAARPVMTVELAYADSDQRRAAVEHLKRAYEPVSRGGERLADAHSLGLQWENESADTDGDGVTRGVAAKSIARDELSLIVPDGRTALEVASKVESSTNALGYRVLDTWDLKEKASSAPVAARGRVRESRQFGALEAATPQPQRPAAPHAPNQPVALGTAAAEMAGTTVQRAAGNEVLRLYFYAGDTSATATRPATTRPAAAATTRPVQTSSAP